MIYPQEGPSVQAYTVRDYRRIEVNLLEIDVTDFTRYDYVVVQDDKGTTVVINCRNILHVMKTEDGKVEVKLPNETITISQEGILITP